MKLKKLISAVLVLIFLIMSLSLGAYAGNTLYWPVPGHTVLSQEFHDGNAIDISDGSIAGATVIAAMGGTVTHIYLCGQQHYGSFHDCSGFGTGLVIAGDDGRTYQYAHMQGGSIPSDVYWGGRVNAGQVIGRVGTTGYSSGNHLHFAISYGDYWNASGINPMNESYRYDNPNVQVTMTFEGTRCEYDTSNVFVYTKAVANVTGNFTEAGITIWDSKGAEVGHKSESVSYNRADLEIWYNAAQELGITLQPGTDYSCRIYTVFNGKRYETEIISFRTAGEAPTEPPTQPSPDIYGDTLIIEDFAQDYVVVLEEELLIATVAGVDPEDFMDFFKNPEMTIHYSGSYVGTGNYLDFAQKQYDIIVFNDANGDGRVTAADARLTLRAAASLEDFDILQFYAADVDSNERITAADARAILRIAAGLE